jgi:hypothetical protein
MSKADKWTRSTNLSSERSRAGHRRPRRHATSGHDEIYDELLQEALHESPQDENRPLKRRKSQRDQSQVVIIDDTSSGDNGLVHGKSEEVVVIDSSSEINSTDEQDEQEWDDIDLTALPISEDITESEATPAVRHVTLATTPQKPT